MLKKLFWTLALSSMCLALDGKTYSLKNDALEVCVSVDDIVTWSVKAGGIPVLSPSAISMTFADGTVLGASPKVLKASVKDVQETIQAPLYRQSRLDVTYRMLDIRFAGGWALEFRLYPDGAAYRFRTAFSEGKCVREEQAEFRFAQDFPVAVTYTTPRKDKYGSSFEDQYVFEKVSDAASHTTFAYAPLYVNAGEAGRFLITESDVEQYPGMFLRSGGGSSYVVEHPLYPGSFFLDEDNARYPKTREDYIAKVDGTRTFPWRMLIYGKTDVDLANNDMVYKTASPCRVADTSWISGGHSTWDWWNSIRISGVDFVSGINTQTYKYYVDFAAEFGIENILIDDGWYSYKTNNLLEGIPECNIPEIVEYAKSKGVGVMLWAVGNTFESRIEEVCEHYSRMGVKGFKVDFFDRQDQEFVESVYHMAEVTSRYGLTIDYHGMYKPTGLSRTYPNVVNYEGVFGLEQLKWTDGLNADMPLNDVMLPFTRGAVGPMDYTPGAMVNATRQNFRAIRHMPMSQGTRAHQVALYVLFDSPVVMLCDTPTNYIREAETTRYITSIPTVFDESRVIDGAVGEYVVTTRRKGSSWYVGGITTWVPRDVTVDLSFLGDGEYSATIFSDGANADRIGEDYVIRTLTVNSGSKLDIHCAPGGGFAVVLNRK